MPRQPRTPRKPRVKQAPEPGTTVLYGVTVERITDHQVRFVHAGIAFWAPLHVFAGRDLRPNTRTVVLRDRFAHYVQPVGGRRVLETPGR